MNSAHTQPQSNQYRLYNTKAIDSQVNDIDLEKLKWKLTQSTEADWDENTYVLAEQEYRRFLSIKKWNPKIEIVPTKLVDKLWHQHILDTHAYEEDCQNVFGYFLHHFPYFGIYGQSDQQNLQVVFEQTQNLYREYFGEPPCDLQAMRCKGHACHAPTSCACRNPGACK